MSRMRSFLKPPLPKSPIRLRSRQVLQSYSSSLQTPTGSVKKFPNPGRRLSDAFPEPKLPVEYDAIANEIHAFAKMVKDEISEEEERKSRDAGPNLESLAVNSVPVFERGRFYAEYSAKRNERLKRKKGGEEEVVKGTPYNLGVNHETMTTKRRGTSKKQFDSIKKTVSMVETTPRYSLRSMTKENKKPPLPLNVSVSAMKTVTTRRIRKV